MAFFPQGIQVSPLCALCSQRLPKKPLHAQRITAPIGLAWNFTRECGLLPLTSAEDQEFLEIKVLLVREAGEANAWRRINKAFINQLRKQLLMWRSLDEVARARYERALDAAQKGKEVDFAL
ncbi:MAG: hypothetical protein JRF50_16365 [Deltaproteobacteria bacterium]|nr:hypothetical protein [Deltaproteobacteria bacterium]